MMHKVVIIGASRGIGKALAGQMALTGSAVIATVRGGSTTLGFVHPNIETVLLDMAEPDAGCVLEDQVGAGWLDAIIVNAGIFGPSHQDVAQVERDEAADLFWINAVAPVRLARRLLPLVRRGGVVAFLSSRTASIAVNTDGDMELYRASKTALNALSRSFAVKHALPAGVGVLLLHPGWVQTDMGGSDAPVTVEDSARGLRTVIEAALDDPAHRFVDHEGAELPW